MSVTGGYARKLLGAEHVGVRELRNKLSAYVREESTVIVTKRGTPEKVMLPYEELVELLDIIDELSDPKTLEAVREGREAIDAGADGIPVENTLRKFLDE